MASDEKWYFTKENLENTPSRQCSIDGQKELFYRQQAANFIQDMGQRLKVSQLCINTASVYMHRFYVFHSFTHFPWSSIAAAALFLSAKVEEQPRKLEHVIRVHNICKNPRDSQSFDINSEKYQAQCQDLVFNENVLLQTLGFDVAIDHPHAHVVRCCHLVRASKDLAQSSYFMASTSLHLTTFCLQYKPTVVACFCIHLACKWSNWEIPLSKEKKEWFSYVDPTVTSELLSQLTEEFLVIFSKCPSRLKEKILSNNDGTGRSGPSSGSTDPEMKKYQQTAEAKDTHKLHYDNKLALDADQQKSRHASQHQQQREREYREKKERERLSSSSSSSHQHKIPSAMSSSSASSTSSSSKFPTVGGHPRHPTTVDPKMKLHSSSRSSFPAKAEHRESSGSSDSKDLFMHNKNDEKQVHGGAKSSDLAHLDTLSFSSDRKADLHRLRNENLKLQGAKQENNARRVADESKAMKEADLRKQLFAANPHHAFDKSSAGDKNWQLGKSMYSFKQSGQAVGTDAASKPIPKSIKNEYPHESSSCNNGSSHSLFDVVDRKPFAKKPSVFSPEKTPPRKANDATSKQQQQQQSTTAERMQQAAERMQQQQQHSLMPPFCEVQKDKKHSPKVLSNLAEPMNKPEPKDQFRIGSFKGKEESSLSSYLQPTLTDSSSGLSSSLGHPIVNGIETNPTLISTLLKEAPPVPHLPSIANSLAMNENTAAASNAAAEDSSKSHKDRKKKSKEKHKHKDKPKDEKEKKRKHKDKDKEKQKSSKSRGKGGGGGSEEFSTNAEQPIKITISKDKIQSSESSMASHNLSNMGLKIKIPKDKIKTDMIQEPGIKIKISKDVISNLSGGGGGVVEPGSKKREHDRSSSSSDHQPPSKVAKSGNSRYSMSDKSNGRSSLPNKVGPSTSDNFKNAQ